MAATKLFYKMHMLLPSSYAMLRSAPVPPPAPPPPPPLHAADSTLLQNNTKEWSKHLSCDSQVLWMVYFSIESKDKPRLADIIQYQAQKPKTTFWGVEFSPLILLNISKVVG